MDGRADLSRRAIAEGSCSAIAAVGAGAAIAIGGTVGLDALFGGPITGASMNPARSIGPALVSGEVHDLWIEEVRATRDEIERRVVELIDELDD